ncbi:hypothetical protein FACS189413_18220 [Bacteroidia bacterium]|nr:hypothetical protein FACS189413_18220 [Bacteroidia bacterium]
MKKIKTYIHSFLLFFPAVVFGQEALTVAENLAIRGSVQENTIRLRWAPANAQAWLDGKKYGYVLEKIPVFKNDVFQPEGALEKIDPIFLPAPLADWEALVNRSDYAAVVAQAFYGEDFLVSAPHQTVGDIINQSNELQQRFATSLFAAEYDYQAAVLAGWAWTDPQLKADERYLYRIYLNKPQPERGDTAVVVLGLSNRKKLPVPIGLNAVFGDKGVMLSWNYFYQSDIYHSYHVERAASGEAFQQITKLPVTLMSENKEELFYMDSLPDNTQTYTYRIRGITTFDETGPYSEEVSGKGKASGMCVPVILYGDFIAKNQAKIGWTIECDHPEQIHKLEFKQAPGIDGEYISIPQNILPTQREAILTLKDAKNYVQLFAYTQEGEVKSSFPFLLQQVDSVPPAIPTGLKVQIDSLAIAHLSWDANQEPDLRGYRILRSFTESGEKSSLTPQLLTTNEYTDTLSLQLGNEAVFYAMTAIDTYYNESPACETVKAIKPNNKRPADPVITHYKVDDNRVHLSWITDKKDPAVTYSLVRAFLATEPPQKRVVVSGNYQTNEYTDQVEESGKYAYTVYASTGNPAKTIASPAVTLDIQLKESLDAVTEFSYYKDTQAHRIELFWRKHPKAIRYILYKSEDAGPLTLLKETDAEQTRFVDTNVSPDTKYTYTVLYQVESGKKSKVKSVIVHF